MPEQNSISSGMEGRALCLDVLVLEVLRVEVFTADAEAGLHELEVLRAQDALEKDLHVTGLEEEVIVRVPEPEVLVPATEVRMREFR